MPAELLGGGGCEHRGWLAFAGEGHAERWRLPEPGTVGRACRRTRLNRPGQLWLEIVRFMEEAGYAVVCIDQRRTHGQGLAWTQIPNGAEDRSGLSLRECARLLRHVEFFVGLSGGLTWLAWAAGIPVVMISGFSHPTTEFETPRRVINGRRDRYTRKLP
jgi:autotransporter strand-loop-strand O-heptosyltransferase